MAKTTVTCNQPYKKARLLYYNLQIGRLEKFPLEEGKKIRNNFSQIVARENKKNVLKRYFKTKSTDKFLTIKRIA